MVTVYQEKPSIILIFSFSLVCVTKLALSDAQVIQQLLGFQRFLQKPSHHSLQTVVGHSEGPVVISHSPGLTALTTASVGETCTPWLTHPRLCSCECDGGICICSLREKRRLGSISDKNKQYPYVSSPYSTDRIRAREAATLGSSNKPCFLLITVLKYSQIRQSKEERGVWHQLLFSMEHENAVKTRIGHSAGLKFLPLKSAMYCVSISTKFNYQFCCIKYLCL